jgi:hypothetical protein
MDGIANLASTVANRFSTNIHGSFTNLTWEKVIRIIVVAGACE